MRKCVCYLLRTELSFYLFRRVRLCLCYRSVGIHWSLLLFPRGKGIEKIPEDVKRNNFNKSEAPVLPVIQEREIPSAPYISDNPEVPTTISSHTNDECGLYPCLAVEVFRINTNK